MIAENRANTVRIDYQFAHEVSRGIGFQSAYLPSAPSTAAIRTQIAM